MFAFEFRFVAAGGGVNWWDCVCKDKPLKLERLGVAGWVMPIKSLSSLEPCLDIICGDGDSFGAVPPLSDTDLVRPEGVETAGIKAVLSPSILGEFGESQRQQREGQWLTRFAAKRGMLQSWQALAPWV